MTSAEGVFAASPEQVRAWQRRAAEPEAAHAYWSELALSLKEPVDPALLARRLHALVAREEIVRTELEAMAGLSEPVQRVCAAPAEARVQREVVTASAGGALFAGVLAAGPPALQVALAGDRTLVLRAPSSHLDGPSLRRIARELLDGRASAAPSLQHADYAEWKRGLAAAEPADESVAFWRAQPPPTAAGMLGLERAAGGGAFRPASVELAWPSDAAARLREVAAAHGCTPRGLCLAGFAGWLARLADRDELVVGCESDARGALLEDAIGPYARALPVRISLERAAPIARQADAIEAAYAAALSFYAGCDDREDAAYVFAWTERFDHPRVAEVVRERAVIGRFALRLAIEVGPEGLRGRLDYDPERFDANAVACLREQWEQLAGALLAGGAEPLGAIDLRGDAQRRRIAPLELPRLEPRTVCALIERQAAATPQARAVADAAGALSYGALNARANRLARALRERGVGAGEVVAILLPPCADVIVAILASHKLGAVYLPLDPAYPRERLEYMLADAGARVVIHDRARAGVLDVQRATALCLEDAGAELERHASEDLGLEIDLESIAYLIYTSGSTGRPKAVEITQASLSRSTQVRCSFYSARVRAYLLLSSFSFDSSVAGIFWTLAQGGTLVLPDPEVALDPRALAQLCAAEGVSHGLSLPSVYEALLDVPEFTATAGLALWIVAGESCRASVVEKHCARLPQVELWNEYGPTEATVWATAGRLTAGRERVSIGRAIPGMRLWLLNEAGAPAALGEPGEIYLGGRSLARGYRGRPEQTAERFFVHPGLGERVYRTSDRARFDARGCLEFLGRSDRQIKLRGHRIELGEIERCLAEHAEVREAAVVARETPSGVALRAYVQAAPGAELAADLRAHLRERLPAYMQPSSLHVLAALPRTPNGKLDLAALPHTDPDEAAYRAPEGPLEAELAALCAEVLRVPRVSRDASFFELGGDSITSLQLCARAAQRGLVLRVRDVFEHKTIASIAAVARREGEAGYTLDARHSVRITHPDAARALALAAERPDGLVALAAAALQRAQRAPLRLILEQPLPAGDVYRTLHDLGCDVPPGRALEAAKRALREPRELEPGASADVCMRNAGEPPASAAAPLWIDVGAERLQLAASSAAYSRERLAELADRLERALAELAGELEAAAVSQPSAEDFPAAGLDAASLAALLASLES